MVRFAIVSLLGALPFVVGGYYIDDKELVEVGGKNVSVSVKRGGAVSINK